MEMENKYGGRATAGLTTGIIGTALGAMGTGIIPGLFGGGNCANSDNVAVNRYEMNLQRDLTNKDMEIAYLKGRDAAKSDSLELYKYVDGKFANIERELAAQAVKNAQVEGTFAVLGEKIAAGRNEFLCALNRERDERCCGDNSIVNYANATFYPKLVADVTAATTTTAQSVYNPIPGCNCCK